MAERTQEENIEAAKEGLLTAAKAMNAYLGQVLADDTVDTSTRQNVVSYVNQAINACVDGLSQVKEADITA